MTKLSIILFLLLVTSLFSTVLHAAPNPEGLPDAQTQTLFTSLSRDYGSIGDDVTWLVWTDPNCSGQQVNLQIRDSYNGTIVYDVNQTLGTFNQCGSLTTVISTVGFEKHGYQFGARMALNDMRIESWHAFYISNFDIRAYPQYWEFVRGETVQLRIYETAYPMVSAHANVTLYNNTNPSVWSLTDVSIPESTGSTTIYIPTTDLTPADYSYYYINVTAESELGTAFYQTSFNLVGVIVTMETQSYRIGDLVNVSIRADPNATQAGLWAWGPRGWLVDLVVDEYIPLTNGQGFKSYNSSDWPVGYWYYIQANATANGSFFIDNWSFGMDPFVVVAECEEYCTMGESANINVQTVNPQPSAQFNITITNSTLNEVWVYGPQSLSSEGTATVAFNTTGLPSDEYSVLVVVNNTPYSVNQTTSFTLVPETFEINASLDQNANPFYLMLMVNLTVTPEQKNASLSLEVWNPSTRFSISQRGFNLSDYTYLVPLVGAANGTCFVELRVTSTYGVTKWAFDFMGGSFEYSGRPDSDGDGLPDSQELLAGTFPNNPDSDGDGFFDGMEVFHGANPLDPTSMIPEYPLILTLPAFMLVTLTLVIVCKRRHPDFSRKP